MGDSIMMFLTCSKTDSSGYDQYKEKGQAIRDDHQQGHSSIESW
jgi:hypothetical protein